MDKEENQKNEPKNEKFDDYAQGLTSERWHRRTTCVKKRKKDEDSPALKIA